MLVQLDLGSLCIEVEQKNIKNVHLSVYPPLGKVRISAPQYMDMDTIRMFAISKLAWIKSQQRKILAQDRETPREYLSRESHYVWGQRYLLEVIEKDAAPQIVLQHRKLLFQVRPNTDESRRQALLDAWYREQIKAAIPALLEKWQPIMGVMVARVFIQRMKTKWGSCSHHARNIRLNTDLAKKPPECLEYIVVHELAHLIEPSHNARFMALMELYIPNWRHLKDELNRLPVRHEDWRY